MTLKSIPITAADLETQHAEGARHLAELRAKGPVPSSACVWHPALERAGGFNMPRTEMVEFNPETLDPVIDGKEPDGFLFGELETACERIGYPVFLRTDCASAKHDGPVSFRAESSADLVRCVKNTYYDNALKDMWFVRAFMVREYLHIRRAFTAFNGLPIGREWRLFANQETVTCEHFYWPEEAFRYSENICEGWRQLLQRLSSDVSDVDSLRPIALRAAQAIGEGAWSVDFAQDVNGKWWLIDMARAHQSWHPKHKEQA